MYNSKTKKKKKMHDSDNNSSNSISFLVNAILYIQDFIPNLSQFQRWISSRDSQSLEVEINIYLSDWNLRAGNNYVPYQKEDTQTNNYVPYYSLVRNLKMNNLYTICFYLDGISSKL